MGRMFTLLLLFTSFGSLLAMENGPAILFENKNRETIAVPGKVVAQSRLLTNEYERNKVCSSIGTHGHVSLDSPDLQDIKLLQKCIDLESYTPEQLCQELAGTTKVDDLGSSFEMMEMSQMCNFPRLSQFVARAIAAAVHSQKRCEIFKSGILNRLQSKPEILNLVAQEILAKQDKAKEYWITKIREKNKNLVWGMEQQLNSHLTPAKALVLLDAYENKAEGKPISFAPGTEQIVPRDLRDLVKPSFSAACSYRWSRIDPKVKWSLAGLGAATCAAAGYGLYNWYMSK